MTALIARLQQDMAAQEHSSQMEVGEDPLEVVGARQQVHQENQALKSALHDLKGHHRDALARLETSTQGARAQQSHIADLQVQHAPTYLNQIIKPANVVISAKHLP